MYVKIFAVSGGVHLYECDRVLNNNHKSITMESDKGAITVPLTKDEINSVYMMNNDGKTIDSIQNI